MTESAQEKRLRVFFEVHSGNPREGPGSDRSTRSAYSLVAELPPAPRILDVGCGPGMQTLCLAELSRGCVVAADNHLPFFEGIRRKIGERGLSGRVFPVAADMNRLPFRPGSFDLVWAEGSIYIAGLENGLALLRPLLEENGSIAFTEISWLRDDIPEEPARFWEREYPAMGPVSRNTEILESAGFEPLGTFVLPESDWWDEYYNNILAKIPLLKSKYRNDAEALQVLDLEEAEMNLYRKYSSFYGYVFYIGRRRGK